MEEPKHKDLVKLLEVYRISDIIDIFSEIDNKIISLHETASSDFLSFSYKLKTYYAEVQKLTDSAKKVFEFFVAPQFKTEIEKLYNYCQKATQCLYDYKQIVDSENFRIESQNDILNMVSVTLKNISQNLNTLKYAITNLRFTLKKDYPNQDNKIENSINKLTEEISKLKKDIELINQEISNIKLSKITEIQQLSDFSINIESEFKSVIEILSDFIHSTNERVRFAQKNNHLIAEYSSVSFENISNIILNLQYHDIIRQKMEHISATHKELLEELNHFKNSDNNVVLFGQAKYASQIPEIAELQAAQLVFTNKEYQKAIESITSSFVETGNKLIKVSELTGALGGVNFSDNMYLNNVKYNFIQITESVKLLSNKVLTFGESEIEKYFRQKYQTSTAIALKNIENFAKNLNIENNESNETFKIDFLANEIIVNLMSDISKGINSLNSIFNVFLKQTEKNTLEIQIPENSLAQNSYLFNYSIYREIGNCKINYSVSDEIRKAIENVKYYDFFDKIIDQIIIQLNFVYNKIVNKEMTDSTNTGAFEKMRAKYTTLTERVIHDTVLNKPNSDTENNETHEGSIELF